MRSVTIIGAGGMGRWFARYFLDRGFSVSITDIDKEKARRVAEEFGIVAVDRPSREEDVILIAVYLSKARDVIRSLNKYGRLLVDISSVKSPINEVMREGTFTPLSIHPLFGPGAKTLSGKNIVVTPIRDREWELNMAKELFPEAKILVMNEKEHDRAVAYAIQLPYLLAKLASKVLEGMTPLPIEGTSFSMLKMMIGLSMYSSDKLMKDMAEMNPYYKEVVDKVRKCLDEFGEVHEIDWMDLKEEYERAYRCLEANLNDQP